MERRFVRWMELNSTDSGARLLLARVQLLEGKQKEAFANLRKGTKLAKPNDELWLRLMLAYAYAVTGRREEAPRVLAIVERPTDRPWPPSTEFAGVYATLGDINEALA